MKKLVAIAMLVAFVSPALAADEFYVVQDVKTKKCTVVDKKPATTTETTIVGNGVYKTKVEAETGMKSVKVCHHKLVARDIHRERPPRAEAVFVLIKAGLRYVGYRAHAAPHFNVPSEPAVAASVSLRWAISPRETTHMKRFVLAGATTIALVLTSQAFAQSVKVRDQSEQRNTHQGIRDQGEGAAGYRERAGYDRPQAP